MASALACLLFWFTQNRKLTSFIFNQYKMVPHRRLQTILLSLAILLVTVNSQSQQGGDLPESVVEEQLNDTPQVLLIQTTDDGTATSVLAVPCGKDTYYTTSATVLEVKRTIDTSATAIGAANEGRVMKVCDTLQFDTYETTEKVDESCIQPTNPGRKEEGWCGTVYLTRGMDPTGPYTLSAGYRSFVEEDKSVCEEAMKKCVSPSGSGNGMNGAGDGSEGVAESSKSGSGLMNLGFSFVVALFAATVASWGI